MILQGKEEIVAEAKRIIDARLGEESSRYSFIPALDDRAALALWQRIVAAHCGSAVRYLRGAHERDLLDEPIAPDPFGAPLRGLDLPLDR